LVGGISRDHVALVEPRAEVEQPAALGTEGAMWVAFPGAFAAALGADQATHHAPNVAGRAVGFTDENTTALAIGAVFSKIMPTVAKSSTVGPDDPRDDARSLAGICVLTFESRRRDELREMLERRGATVIAAPSMREVPLSDDPAARQLFAAIETGTIDVLILLTGVGTRALVDAVRDRYGAERIATLLGSVVLVARGPKPVAALRALDLKPALVVPEPNTWREILATIDRELPVAGRRVAVQEYGQPNPELLDGLAERGAAVTRVPVYRWALPVDLAPLREAIPTLIGGRADVAVFTSATQLDHVIRVAAEMPGRDAALIGALRERVVVASIGPVASAALEARGIGVDVVPEHPKLGPLVAALAGLGPGLVASKRARNL
jgi:uroporphyrinogen-III synthase